MKYISFTFDDGRNDNYHFAFPIMRKYGITGTIFCTTGYVDGSWKKKEDWYSAEQPVSVEQLDILAKAGWEIGVHGDRHITSLRDTNTSIEKIKKWDLYSCPLGFSIPDSLAVTDDLESIIENKYPHDILYIRGGRNRKTHSVGSVCLFCMATYLKNQWAFNRFNINSVSSMDRGILTNIPSVVVRYKDDPHMLLKFIETVPDESWVVLMFHSVLPFGHRLLGSDPWCYDIEMFEILCRELASNINTQVKNMNMVVDMINKRFGDGVDV